VRWGDRARQRLKLRDLHVFITAAQLGSMGKAAAELAVSQPAVSKAIADLEEALGVSLLDRSRQGINPTIYGRAWLKWSIAVFDVLKQGTSEIDYLEDPTAGELRIGSTEPMTAGLIPAVIDRLSRQYPRLIFNVIQAQAIALQYRDLRERNIDLILGRLVTPLSDEDLDSEVLFEDPLFVVAGTSSKWLRRRTIEPVELIDELWCLPAEGGHVRARIAEAFRSKGLGLPRQAVLTSSIQLCNALLATGRFLAVLSGSALHISGKRLGMRILPVAFPVPHGPVGIVTLKNRTISPAARLFIECAREIAKPLSKTLAGPRGRVVEI